MALRDVQPRIDRRIAILAAGLAERDAAGDYVCDVFTGHREEPEEKNMAVNYARHGMELGCMGEDEMAAKFNSERPKPSATCLGRERQQES